jgi:16S rRNA (cytosine1402-N4)-methyltransferase
VIVDGTVGAGGHSEALLKRGASVIGIDRDPRALAHAKSRLAPFSERFTGIEGNYADVEQLIPDRLPVNGLLLDLGVSSPQLEDPTRGFSFQHDGPLDMRMGTTGPTAAELIRSTDERVLSSLIRVYGEERFAKPIARALKKALPETTFQAVAAIRRAVPRRAWPKKIHVATKTFQALRILVNGELDALERTLNALPRILGPHGIAAIISFHSLEDRAVKSKFSELQGRCRCPPGLPICACGAQGSFLVLTKKPVVADQQAIRRNPRARSARLRAVERVR